MSIIQSLRDKAAWIVTVAIAFALLVFVVQEGFQNKSLFSGSSSTLGKVNGTTIDRLDFEEKFKRIADSRADAGYTMSEQESMQQREALWNEYVDDAILSKEYEKLGIEVTEKELGDYLYGANPPQDFRQQFTDPNTGMYDGNQAYNAVQQIRRQRNTPQGQALFNQVFNVYFPAVIKMRQREKLEVLMGNSYYAPKWLVEKTMAENNQITSVSFVKVPFEPTDTAIKVTDAEINEYINKHKSLYKQEKAAGIDYVVFSGAPTKADSAEVLQRLTNLKDSFATTTNVAQFLQTESSQMPYHDAFIPRNQIQIAQIDSIIQTPQGSVYGPYIDGSAYVMARVMGSKTLPENVSVRHILIATAQRTQQGMVPVLDETTAKNRADSIATAIKNGANFDTLCRKYSDDGTRETGGLYDTVPFGQMVTPFNDFIFGNPVGTKDVVQTEFGFHYIEILRHRGATPAYKIAYYAQLINPSDETENNAQSAAAQFASESRSRKQFEENAKKRNLPIYNAAEIKPLDVNINGVGVAGANAREMVRWIFNEAEVGDVASSPYHLDIRQVTNSYSVYVVPVVTQLFDEGTMTADRARGTLESTIRLQKKAKQIQEKIANATTLDAVSKALNQPIQRADSVSFSAMQAVAIGFEPKVIGAAFNKNYQNKVSPAIPGQNGIFIIQTSAPAAVPNPNMDIKSAQGMMRAQASYAQRMIIQNLRKKADIKDNRYKYF
jgi:peptidyl-prolyl cis-trans isomerase D